MWKATRARARRTASFLLSSPMLGWATGSDHKKRPSRSMSPLSSSVSQTAATCDTLKLSVGRANMGVGMSGKVALETDTGIPPELGEVGTDPLLLPPLRSRSRSLLRSLRSLRSVRSELTDAVNPDGEPLNEAARAFKLAAEAANPPKLNAIFLRVSCPKTKINSHTMQISRCTNDTFTDSTATHRGTSAS